MKSSNSAFAILIRWNVCRIFNLMKYFVLSRCVNVSSINDKKYLFFLINDSAFYNQRKIVTICSSSSWTLSTKRMKSDLQWWILFRDCSRNTFWRFWVLFRTFCTEEYSLILHFSSKRFCDRMIYAKRKCWMLFYRTRQEIHDIQKIEHSLSRCLTCCVSRNAFLRFLEWWKTDVRSFSCSSCWTLTFQSLQYSSQTMISSLSD
jgi:hypothetical protein